MHVAHRLGWQAFNILPCHPAVQEFEFAQLGGDSG